jgi:hypothetical protein
MRKGAYLCMNNPLKHVFVILVLAWAFVARGQETGAVATLGSVQVNAQTKTMVISGWVNQVWGAIELLACGPGGKTHESVFVLDCNPVDMQAGLLLLGLKPGTPPTGMGQGQPEGPALDIWVDWLEGTNQKSVRAESFVVNVEDDRRPLPETPWVFTGSVFEDGQFKALAEESLVVTYWDPWAIVNLPLICGSKHGVLSVNSNSVPPLSTPVTLRFSAH